jgi:hypothetical protein
MKMPEPPFSLVSAAHSMLFIWHSSKSDFRGSELLISLSFRLGDEDGMKTHSSGVVSEMARPLKE